MKENKSEIGKDEQTEKEYQLLTGLSNDSEKPIDLINNYLPEKNDYEAKTILKPNHPQKIATLKALPLMIPEIKDHSEVIDTWLDHYLKSITSIEGMSRDEFLQILNSLSGGKETTSPRNDTLLNSLLQPKQNQENKD